MGSHNDSTNSNKSVMAKFISWLNRFDAFTVGSIVPLNDIRIPKPGVIFFNSTSFFKGHNANHNHDNRLIAKHHELLKFYCLNLSPPIISLRKGVTCNPQCLFPKI